MADLLTGMVSFQEGEFFITDRAGQKCLLGPVRPIWHDKDEQERLLRDCMPLIGMSVTIETGKVADVYLWRRRVTYFNNPDIQADDFILVELKDRDVLFFHNPYARAEFPAESVVGACKDAGISITAIQPHAYRLDRHADLLDLVRETFPTMNLGHDAAEPAQTPT